jgi:hypothetical protein
LRCNLRYQYHFAAKVRTYSITIANHILKAAHV